MGEIYVVGLPSAFYMLKLLIVNLILPIQFVKDFHILFGVLIFLIIICSRTPTICRSASYWIIWQSGHPLFQVSWPFELKTLWSKALMVLRSFLLSLKDNLWHHFSHFWKYSNLIGWDTKRNMFVDMIFLSHVCFLWIWKLS